MIIFKIEIYNYEFFRKLRIINIIYYCFLKIGNNVYKKIFKYFSYMYIFVLVRMILFVSNNMEFIYLVSWKFRVNEVEGKIFSSVVMRGGFIEKLIKFKF